MTLFNSDISIIADELSEADSLSIYMFLLRTQERHKGIVDGTREEVGFWQSACAGLLVNYVMRARGGDDAISYGIDFSKPSAANDVMLRIFAAGIPSGTYDENGCSLETVSRICKEVGASDVVAEYFSDMDEALAQNRAFFSSIDEVQS